VPVAARTAGRRAPERRAIPAILVAVATAAVLAVVGAPASGHGEEVEVVVEALSRGGDDLGVVDYGITLTFADDDPVTDAIVALSAVPGDGVTVDPVTETVPGVYIGELVFPAIGEWRVTVGFEHPDAEGSVEFTQPIRDPAPAAPVVMVDTLSPDRVGTVASRQTSILGPTEAPSPPIVELSAVVVVEAFIATPTNPLQIEYAATVTEEDDANADAVLTLSAEETGGATVGPIVLADRDGVHRATVSYPTGGSWTVSLEMTRAGGTETVAFNENLPWPHYTTEAGQPKVKYDSEDPSRIGTIAAAGNSVYLSGTPEPAPSTTPPGVVVVATVDDVVLDLPNSGDELRQDIGLRFIHLLAIACWSIPVFGAILGRSGRLTVPVALVGMGVTIVSGIVLAAWGAPLSYPGLFRWAELQERLYGASYGAAFITKMVAVALAAVATVAWALRRSRTAAWATMGAMAGALLAVTAMGQFHLFSHL
jgi:hypothetical protein